MTDTLGQLAQFKAALAGVADTSSPMHREMTERLGDEAIRLAQQCFDRQSDPYGAQWQETKKGTPALRSLREGFTAQPNATGFVVDHDNPVAIYHQFGTRRGVPARAFLPDEARGLPAEWNAALARVSDEVRKKYLGS